MDNALIGRLMASLFRSRKSDLLLVSCHGVSLVEVIILKWIEHNTLDSETNVYAGELQSRLSVSKAAVSQMLGGLEKRGLIRREINESNRRKMDITLSVEGREALTSSQGFYADMMGQIVGTFGEDKLTQMIDLFDEFSGIVETVAREKMDEETLTVKGVNHG